MKATNTQRPADPGARHTGSGALLRRFMPYLTKYKGVMFLTCFALR